MQKHSLLINSEHVVIKANRLRPQGVERANANSMRSPCLAGHRWPRAVRMI